MQPRLNRGRLIKPESIRQARERLVFIEREIGRIDEQLADPERQKRYGGSLPAYLDWRRRAETSRKLFVSEKEQLTKWLATANHPLLREAYEILRTLRDHDDVEFDERELATIAKLDKFFE